MKIHVLVLGLGLTGLLTLTSPATAKPTQITNELILKPRFSNQANMPQSSKLAQKVLGDEVGAPPSQRSYTLMAIPIGLMRISPCQGQLH